MRRKKNENKSMLAGLIALAEPLFTGFPQVEIAKIHIVEIQTAVHNTEIQRKKTTTSTFKWPLGKLENTEKYENQVGKKCK